MTLRHRGYRQNHSSAFFSVLEIDSILVCQMCDFLETHYLNEQVEAIKKLGDHITNLTRMDASKNKMAEYLFDKHTLEGKA